MAQQENSLSLIHNVGDLCWEDSTAGCVICTLGAGDAIWKYLYLHVWWQMLLSDRFWPGTPALDNSMWSFYMDYFGLVQNIMAEFQQQLSQEDQIKTVTFVSHSLPIFKERKNEPLSKWSMSKSLQEEYAVWELLWPTLENTTYQNKLNKDT